MKEMWKILKLKEFLYNSRRKYHLKKDHKNRRKIKQIISLKWESDNQVLYIFFFNNITPIIYLVFNKLNKKVFSFFYIVGSCIHMPLLKQTLDGTILDAQSATKKLNLKMIFGATIAKVTLIFQF